MARNIEHASEQMLYLGALHSFMSHTRSRKRVQTPMDVVWWIRIVCNCIQQLIYTSDWTVFTAGNAIVFLFFSFFFEIGRLGVINMFLMYIQL
jgi:hypothetical protein